jgi:uncharacterized protein (TIGR02145 family)
LQGSYSLCTGDKISDLTARAGGNVSWYNALTDGTKYASDAALNAANTYYGELGIGNCKSDPRTPVSITLSSCTTAITAADITTFTNVMYDFQKQTLEAYSTGGGVASSYLWEYSTDGGTNFSSLPGAFNSQYYTVPAHFADTYFAGGDIHSKSILFRCTLSNPATNPAKITSNLDILFINTSTAGYGESDGVKYLLLGKGNTTPAFKVSLLSLGQSDNNDAGDLGDFYQWGRVADGHQKTGWSKNASHANIIDATGGTVDGSVTSATVARDGSANYDENRQLGSNSGDYNEKFITDSYGDWGGRTTTDNSRWGDGSKAYNTRASDISLSAWTYPSNNPCPSGWRVPSRWNFWDLYRGTGSDTSPSSSNYTGTDNTWSWRGLSGGSSTVIGGAVITNASGEKLFFPVAGSRSGSSGALSYIGINCSYWSSTYYDDMDYSYLLYFTGLYVNAGSNFSLKANGVSVRCVAD